MRAPMYTFAYVPTRHARPLKDDDEDDDSGSVVRHVENYMCGVRVTEEWIPYLLFGGDLISALASGMTIKFFPLWFKNELGMDPVQVRRCLTSQVHTVAHAHVFCPSQDMGPIWSPTCVLGVALSQYGYVGVEYPL